MVRETEIETTMSYCFMPLGWLESHRQKRASADKDGDTREPPTLQGGVQMEQPLWRILIDSTRSYHMTQGSTPSYASKREENTGPHKDLSVDVHSGISLKSQKAETAQMLIN